MRKWRENREQLNNWKLSESSSIFVDTEEARFLNYVVTREKNISYSWKLQGKCSDFLPLSIVPPPPQKIITDSTQMRLTAKFKDKSNCH